MLAIKFEWICTYLSIEVVVLPTMVNGAISGIPGVVTGNVGALGRAPGLLDLMVKGMSLPVDIG